MHAALNLRLSETLPGILFWILIRGALGTVFAKPNTDEIQTAYPHTHPVPV